MTADRADRSSLLQLLRRLSRRVRMHLLAAGRRRRGTGFDPEGALTYPRKLRIEAPQVWTHHRAGWSFGIHLMEEKLHHPRGTLFLASLSDAADLDLRVREPWVGVLHQPLCHDAPWPDGERVLASPFWRESEVTCRGLFTLSRSLRDQVRARLPGIPADVLPLPSPEPDRPFEPAALGPGRRLLHVGNWLRDPQAFLDVSAPGWDKVLLHPPEMELSDLRGLEDAELRRRVSDEDFDELLATSVVFLRFQEVAGSTTVVECLVRGTPLIVNAHPALREYLGEEYPLFYRDLGEAAALLADREALAAGHRHLRSSGLRERVLAPAFLEALVGSGVYRALLDPEAAPVE